MCFHQLFEGKGLGGCIHQADYGMRMKSMLALFFSITSPFAFVFFIQKENQQTLPHVYDSMMGGDLHTKNVEKAVNKLATF
ncbi:hypothetical protein RDI58_000380 [Solanum bulbocastanum]|uniref:Uncharacterized protein n=1 Tax=Solanum bulbocastanum TaxID=147425 RepID=A0AAN8U3A0_SOLBU